MFGLAATIRAEKTGSVAARIDAQMEFGKMSDLVEG